MTRALLKTIDHRRKVMDLRASLTTATEARQVAINRAVIETLRNPVVARAVARGLQITDPAKI